MRILMLTSRFGTGYGMGYSAFKEAQAMVDAGHILTVVHCNKDITGYNDSRIKFIHVSVLGIPFIDFIFFRRSLKEIFIKYIPVDGYDVVYIQSLEFGVMDFSSIQKPIFYFARSTFLGMRAALKHEQMKNSLVKRFVQRCLVNFERRCMKSSKYIFVKSKIMARELQDLYGIDGSKIRVIPGGIDSTDFSSKVAISRTEFQSKYQIAKDVPTALFAGRIVPQKGLNYFVKAALRLLDKYKFTVIVAGIGEAAYIKNIRNLIEIANHGADFNFIGHVAQQEMSSLLNIVDCVVTPSLYEPFGMINLQAAYLGKAIITTNITGSVEVLSGYTLLNVVEPGSVDTLQRALEIWLNKKQQSASLIDFSGLSWKHVAQEIVRNFQF